MHDWAQSQINASQIPFIFIISEIYSNYTRSKNR